jgi:hypothetical protein
LVAYSNNYSYLEGQSHKPYIRPNNLELDLTLAMQEFLVRLRPLQQCNRHESRDSNRQILPWTR